MDTTALLQPPTGDAAWFAQVQLWRHEAQELKTQLQRTERTYEERLLEVEDRCEKSAYMRELASKDAGDRFLTSAEQEVERLSRTAADAQERAKLSDERVMGLLAESQEAANLMADVSVKFERQADKANSLKRRLQQSEAETEKLRSELESAYLREAEMSKRHDNAESTIQIIMPRLTEESKVEALMAEEAQESKQRLKKAESMFNAQAHDLLSEVRHSNEEQAVLGRKCRENAEVANMHANAGYQWQQRTKAAEEELIRAGLNQHHLWQAARKTRAEQWAHQERLRVAEEQRDRAMYDHAVADQARRDMTKWVVSSIDEVNRSAHMRTSAAPHAASHESLRGKAWVDMLESFRKDQQRSGYGCRSHGPV